VILGNISDITESNTLVISLLYCWLYHMALAYWHGYCYGLGGVCKKCAKAKRRGLYRKVGVGCQTSPPTKFCNFCNTGQIFQKWSNSPLAIFRCVINLSIRLFEIDGDV